MILGLALVCLAKLAGIGGAWVFAVGIVLAILGVFVFFFFRDPERKIPGDANSVVSPADGHVVEIVEESIGSQPGQRISIFLSVFDVHVNRSPVAGRIAGVEYRPRPLLRRHAQARLGTE